MEERNIIKWSEYSGYTELTILSGEIWMSESEERITRNHKPFEVILTATTGKAERNKTLAQIGSKNLNVNLLPLSS